MQIFIVLIAFLLMILLIPAIIGLYFIFRRSRIRKLIGWFIFKPVLATPLFFMAYLGIASSNSQAEYLSLSPGVALTILLLMVYRDLFKGQTSKLAFILLFLDIVRLGSALLSVIFAEYAFCFGRNCPQSTWGPLLFIFTIAFPALYAFLGLIINAAVPRDGLPASTAPIA